MLAHQLQIRHRHVRWQEIYPAKTWTWTDWQSFLIGHNPSGPVIPVTPGSLQGIWNRSNQQTPGARQLLGFEQRTQLGSLPQSTRMCTELINTVADEANTYLNGLWHDLPSHYSLHGRGQELPVLNAAARALRHAASAVPGVTPTLLGGLFPGRVSDEDSYGLLAVSTLVLTQLIDDLVQVRLYCPDAPEKHSLSLNLELSGQWIQQVSGLPGGNGIRIGVTLAGVDNFSLGAKNYALPRLHQHFAISTCFAPDHSSTAKLRMGGYATTVTLT